MNPDPFTGFEAVESPYVAPGTFILCANPSATEWTPPTGLLRLEEPVWPDGAGVGTFAQEYVDDRDRALQWLSVLLDNLCHDFGLDPDEAWRNARRELTRREHRLRDVTAWRVGERIALTINRPDQFVTITSSV